MTVKQNQTRLRGRANRAFVSGVTKPKGQRGKKRPVQVMHSEEDFELLNRVLAARSVEVQMPDLAPPALYRWLLLKEAIARGFVSSNSMRPEPPSSDPASPSPGTPLAPTQRSVEPSAPVSPRSKRHTEG